MEKYIIYKNDDGTIAIMLPSKEAEAIYGLKAIAEKDVPAGKPFKIVNADQLPADWEKSHLWEVDDVALNDGVGSVSDKFPALEK